MPEITEQRGGKAEKGTKVRIRTWSDEVKVQKKENNWRQPIQTRAGIDHKIDHLKAKRTRGKPKSTRIWRSPRVTGGQCHDIEGADKGLKRR